MAANAQIVSTLREGDVPILPDSYLRQKFLKVSDEEGMQDLINEQQGMRIPDASLMITLSESLMNRGKHEQAEEIMLEWQMLRTERMLKMMQMQMAEAQAGAPQGGTGGGPGGGPPQPGGEGIDNAIVPQQVLGAPQPAPTPQSGPIVPPGTERPGAQEG